MPEQTGAGRSRASWRPSLRVAVAVTSVCLVLALALALRACSSEDVAPSLPQDLPAAVPRADVVSGPPRRERLHEETAPAPDEPDAAASEPDVTLVRCVVRDVRTGDAVPGLEVCGRAADVSWTTRDDGSFEAVSKCCVPLWNLRVRTPDGWSIVALEDHTSAAEGAAAVLWACSQVVIEGDVEVQGPLPKRWDASHVAVQAHLVPERRAGFAVPEAATWKPTAFVESDVHADRDGRFRIVVPALPGLEITADARGWIPDRQEPFLQGATPDAPIRMHLSIHKAERLQGRCLDEYGKPVPGAEVHCYIVMREDARRGARFEDARAAYPSGGVTIVSGVAGTRITVHRSARTDADGHFDIPIVAQGETVLVAWARGRATTRQAIAWSGFRDGTDMTLHPSPNAARKVQIVLRADGAPLVRCACVLADLDAGFAIQPAFTITTDERGEIPADWLEDGHRYAISIGPENHEAFTSGSHFFRWSGQSSVVLLDLPNQLSEVR